MYIDEYEHAGLIRVDFNAEEEWKEEIELDQNDENLVGIFFEHFSTHQRTCKINR